ncbi:MAG: Na+/H+ antiporter NhaC [Flavobacteriales bacterium]|nr:Na+/H+ antiporter NhaC [Flavobacteriales bacterium]
MLKDTRAPHFLEAMFPILILIALLALNVVLYKDNATYGPNQIALIVAAVCAAIVGVRLGYTWEHIQKGMIKSINSAMSAVLILLVIGALSGTWMISGVVPTMIYYGLKIMHPSYFLVAAVIISAIVSLATGSSWSTVATVGVALLGIGSVMGINEGMIAGAIISGAYFGDKMSPLSDTTNLAPAMAGTDLFTHIRYMAFTTAPTLLITLIIFAVIGLTLTTDNNSVGVNELLKAMESKFNISPFLFLVPVSVFVLIYFKVDALPALFVGTVVGGIAAIVAQPQIIKELTGISNDYLKASYSAIINAMSGETTIVTKNEAVDKLLTTRGMAGMLNTIWLIVCAMCFGGAMEVSGLLKKITSTVIRKVETTGSLIATTAASCVFFNATASDQYLAIVVPGRMFAKEFKDRGLKPENLSRTLEDSGTVTSVLFPWNTCGAAQASVLHVATGTYWMYCFFNILSPITTIIYGYFNIKIRKYTPEEVLALKEAEKAE